jgi:methionine synthase II (cobalamin-independent)
MNSKARQTIWANFTLPSGNKLYIGSIYHPHTTNMESQTEIKKNLEKAASFDKQTVWVDGDF